MNEPIVSGSETAVLVGGGRVNRVELSKSLAGAPSCVAVDGGANVLHEMGIAPDAVIGDLDSISGPARAAFADRLVAAPDQNLTDFEKALARIDAALFLCHGFSGGRVDHQIAALHGLAREAAKRILLIGPEDVAFRVPEGAFTFAAQPGWAIGLLPFARARVRTRGLRWEIADREMEIDGFLSTSNEVAAQRVDIAARGPLIVTLPPAALPDVTAALRG